MRLVVHKQDKLLFSLLKIVVLGIVFIVGFLCGNMHEAKKLRLGADRVIKTDGGTLVVSKVLHGWTRDDFLTAENIVDLVFDKLSAARHADPYGFSIGYYSTAYGYIEKGDIFEPAIVFLSPPTDRQGHGGNSERDEADEDVIITTVVVPRSDFCPRPPLTYAEALKQVLDPIAQGVVRNIIEYNRIAPSAKTLP